MTHIKAFFSEHVIACAYVHQNNLEHIVFAALSTM